MIALSRRSLRSLRVAAGVGRWLLGVVAITGVVASLRFLIDPPRAIVRSTPAPRDERALVVTATAFARAYLAFDGARPDSARDALAVVTGPAAAAAMAPDVPPTVRQRVRWVDVVRTRRGPDGTRVVTLAADTTRTGVVHLAVAVQRRGDGSLRIVGQPAIVGGPLVAPARPDADARRPAVADRALVEVCRRALGNYLAGAGTNLAADLAPEARVSLPDRALRLDRLRDMRWLVAPRSVVAAVEASDRDGVRYALRYELDVVRAGPRWEIAAIATDPRA
jgi:hypothetical protein